jgi:uncharacterized protein YcnI
MKVFIVAMALIALAAFARSAGAHVTLEQQSAAAGSYYKAVFRVPHGCDGAATTRIRIQIPEGSVSIKPMPKPGWTVMVVRAPLAAPIKGEHATITETVREVSWDGGSLPDEHFDEFALMMKLPDTPGRIFFPTIQECGAKAVRWIDVPAAGSAGGSSRTPAPGLTLTPKANAAP